MVRARCVTESVALPRDRVMWRIHAAVFLPCSAVWGLAFCSPGTDPPANAKGCDPVRRRLELAPGPRLIVCIPHLRYAAVLEVELKGAARL